MKKWEFYISEMHLVAICNDQCLPKGKENDIKETGENEGMDDEEAGCNAICLLAFCASGFEAQ